MRSDNTVSGAAMDYSDGDRTYEAYVVGPPGDEPLPAVILAHEWSGLNDGMKRMAERVAALGYIVFAADLYGKGVRGNETGDNSHLMAPLMADRALLRERMLLALDTASALPAIDASRIAVMGYCFGGLCALDLARAAPPSLKGAISVHGVLSPPALGPQAPIPASILLLHGWEDPFAPRSDLIAVTEELTAAGADWQLHAYGHAQHAFTFEGANKPEQGIAYHPAAARRSWHATEAFLAEVLGSSLIHHA